MEKKLNNEKLEQASGGVQIDAENCVSCGFCAEKCPVNAITLNNGVAQIDYDTCLHCGQCMRYCPTGAIQPKY